eukprot:TRINITY_DN81292_c0_g1_i1.p1 TRINITY_DN81292_c0_g1~~TRINITY_DN81292_c0_g1_i1.p1  ORF type:complete len:349 (+),score=112.89 TRINITY_DN81292_c0_g1_i1:37-1047(+)
MPQRKKAPAAPSPSEAATCLDNSAQASSEGTLAANAVDEAPSAGAAAAAAAEFVVTPVPFAPGHAGQDEFLTVIVTPKLSFQLSKRPEWRTVEDISQDDLRRGFLSRFPPALWMSSEKFSFRPALPPTSQITEDTRSLVFKLVSDTVPDERVMLGILRELEKSYEAIIRRAVSETRSEALHEQLSLQEQAEEARREQEKQVKELRKENKGLRDQLQSIQKRLFLVEQEKDQMRKEQQQLQDRTARLEQARTTERAEQKELREQLELLRQSVEVLTQSGQPHARGGREGAGQEAGEAPAEVSRRVDLLQQQLGGLQGWLLQGSQLLASPAAPTGGVA